MIHITIILYPFYEILLQLFFLHRDVRFDLRYNEIVDVDMDFAELLLDPLENKNVVVLLDGNPLHCDCHAIAFKKFSVKSYHLQYSDLRCASPEHLKGQKFSDSTYLLQFM